MELFLRKNDIKDATSKCISDTSLADYKLEERYL